MRSQLGVCQSEQFDLRETVFLEINELYITKMVGIYRMVFVERNLQMVAGYL